MCFSVCTNILVTHSVYVYNLKVAHITLLWLIKDEDMKVMKCDYEVTKGFKIL